MTSDTACPGCDGLVEIGQTKKQARAAHELLCRIGILHHTGHVPLPGDPAKSDGRLSL
jgi:hypothetical protein